MNDKFNELIEENNKLKEKNNEYELIKKQNDTRKIDEDNNKLKELIEENNIIKEKNKEYEEKETKYKNIQQENEKLNDINSEMNSKNKELEKELNLIKRRFKKLLKEKNISEKEVEEMFKNENNLNFEEKNEDEDYENTRNIYLNRIKDREFLSPEERKLKEERLKNLFKKRVFEMKDYLHRHFMKFYYNGIFVEMKKKAEDEKPTKVVKSTRFNNLISKFNSNSNTSSNNNFLRKNNRQKTIVQKVNNPLEKRFTMIEEENK